MTDATWFDLSQEGKDIWNQNAPFWDETMGEGNAFQRVLIGPATERLLGLQPDELVLDIACGNGNFARRMVALGGRVLAFDYSEAFIERARWRSKEQAGRIDYRVLDATDRQALLDLGRQRFDAAVSSMALMDMAAIEPLFEALRELLKPGGRFVFSVMHPCFNAVGVNKLIEEIPQGDGLLKTEYSVKVRSYLSPAVDKGIGIRGQPEPHYYFHRPLSVLLGHCFQAGFVLDGLEEPAFHDEDKTSNPLSWTQYTEIPPVLVVRLRLG